MPLKRFPDGFLWGTASAAHQVEGDNRNNDWWEFEQRPGRIANGDSSVTLAITTTDTERISLCCAR